MGRLRKRHPLISLGLAWYLICLIPKFYAVLNVVAAEHHFYLSGFGMFLILAVLSQNLYLKFRRYFVYIACGLISICAVLVGFRNYEWRDAFSLWKVAVKVQPRSVIALHNLGTEYSQRGRFAEAEKLFKKSLYLSNSIQNQVRGRVNLAYMLERRGKLTEAEALLKEAERISNKDFSIYWFLGRTYLKMGKEKEAEETWKKGLVLNPFAAEIQINLGKLYLYQNKLKDAKDCFQSAIKSDPNFAEAHNNLAVLYASMDPPQLELAKQHAQKAVVLGYKVEEEFLKMIDLPQAGLHETK